MTDTQSDGKANSPSKELVTPADGTKVPLTAEQDHASEKSEVIKFSSSPSNGDTKVDIEAQPVFTGLNKEELMKYANDPFWVRLRWILFILFWLAWVAMLVVAIIIIVTAEGCAPPPTIDWIQEKAMIDVGESQLDSDVSGKVVGIGAPSVYLSSFISSHDFTVSTYRDAEDDIKNLTANGLTVVTDFPEKVGLRNPWRENASYSLLYDHSTGAFNYSNPGITSAFEDMLNYWIGVGVTGFLMPNITSEDQLAVRDKLNGTLEEGGVVGSGVVDVRQAIREPSAQELETFLSSYTETWSYFKFSPVPDKRVQSSWSDENTVGLMTIGLFGVPGTPILQGALDIRNTTKELVQYLIKMKEYEAIKFGTLNFVNYTTEDVVAYTRVKKGTPAYAMLLNFGERPEFVDFGSTPNVGEDAVVDMSYSTSGLTTEKGNKVKMVEVPIEPRTGLILEFVASF